MLLNVPVAADPLLRMVRFALLGAASLVSVHDAVFVARHGVGADLGAALTRSGHGPVWALVTVVGIVGALVIATEAMLGTRSGRRRRHQRHRAARRAPTFLAELRRLWPPLLIVAGAAFVLQENVEHLVGHGHVAGLDPILGDLVTLPVIALVTFVLAMLGAGFRWYTARTDTRPRRQPHRVLRPGSPRVEPAPGAVGALGRREAIRLRPEAGRAPPVALLTA